MAFTYLSLIIIAACNAGVGVCSPTFNRVQSDIDLFARPSVKALRYPIPIAVELN